MVNGKSVRDVLLAGTGRKTGAKAGSVMELELVWKITLADVSGKFVPQLTMKQRGQLKLFGQRCPESKAVSILEYVLRNWIAFAKGVETQAGITSSPATPSIDFLLKHLNVAVNLALPVNTPQAKKQEAPLAVTADKHVQLIAPQHSEDTPKTVEEVLAILGDKSPSK